MSKLLISEEASRAATEGYAGSCLATGVLSSKLLTPPDYALWLCVSTLASGARLRWDETHGEEAVYVISGSLEVDGHACPTGGAVVVEGGVAAVMTARGQTRIAHYGDRHSRSKKAGECVHVVGPMGRLSSRNAHGAEANFLADSRCPTCDVYLFRADYVPPNGRHSHSQDEIIYILKGTMLLGKHPYGSGTCLCIPANVRYLLQEDSDPVEYLNYRPTASSGTMYDERGQPLDTSREGGRSMVREGGDFVDVVPRHHGTWLTPGA